MSATSTAYGKVLVVGSGANAGCSLYVLTSDAFHARTGDPVRVQQQRQPPRGCVGQHSLPALLTNGAPIAGPGINPTLLEP